MRPSASHRGPGDAASAIPPRACLARPAVGRTARGSTANRLLPVGNTSLRPRHGDPAGPGATRRPLSAARSAARSPAAQASKGMPVSASASAPWSGAGVQNVQPLGHQRRLDIANEGIEAHHGFARRHVLGGVVVVTAQAAGAPPRPSASRSGADRGLRRGNIRPRSCSIACKPSGSLPALIGGVIWPMVTAPRRRLAAAASPDR